MSLPESDKIKEVGKETPYLSFPVFSRIPWLLHGFSTRRGGVSKGDLSSLNLSFSRGDEPEYVVENYHRIAHAIGFSTEQLVFTQQVHGSKLHKAESWDAQGNSLLEPKLKEMDGLYTDVPGLVLGASFADCVPIFLVDPVHRAIGLSHSGWRGTVEKIGKKTVEALETNFQSKPEECLAVIGPSIGPECYEVGEEVANAMAEAFPFDRKKILSPSLTHPGKGHYQLNLWKACELTLLEAGLSPNNITVSELCTCCHRDELFSHRGSGGKRGNMMGFLGIREM